MAGITDQAAKIINDALREAAKIIGTINDPLERAEAADFASEAGRRVQGAMKVLRQRAFEDARQTMSVEQIAGACGITRARVYQILDGR